MPILGRGFDTGGYKCECKQGYEYAFEDPITYFDGQRVDAEFVNMIDNKKNLFDMYQVMMMIIVIMMMMIMTMLLMVMIMMMMLICSTFYSAVWPLRSVSPPASRY